MTSVFANNAYSALAANITTSTTAIVLSTGEGARFPAPTGSDYFYVTFIDTANNLEIAKCTSRAIDTLTVVRAQEGTTATAYAVGDRVEQRVTAAGLTDIITAAATSATNAATSETNAATSATGAATSETNAATSETNAATSETNAATSETNAATSETNAAASAASAANNANAAGTSTTSVAIAVASKSFTTQTGKFFEVGQWLLITSDADGANYMHGQSTAYDTATGALTVNVVDIGGSGTFTDWTIRLSGTRGAVGATGQPQWQGSWLTATAYVVNDSVYEDGSSYICLVDHTSGVFADDLTALDWELMAQKGIGDVNGPSSSTDLSLSLYSGTTGKLLQDGPVLGTAGQVMTSGGAGVAPSFQTPAVALLPANNLSDVVSAPTSINNLVAPGVSGNVMTSNGTNWTSAAGGGGAWSVKSNGTFSAVANFDFTAITKTTKIILTNMTGSTNAVLNAQTSSDGGTTFDGGATDYVYTTQYYTSGATNSIIASAGTTYINLGTGGISSTTDNDSTLIVVIGNPSSATKNTVIGSNEYQTGSTVTTFSEGGGARLSAAIVDAMRIYPSAGTMSGSYVVMELN